MDRVSEVKCSILTLILILNGTQINSTELSTELSSKIRISLKQDSFTI